jgi:chromosomal replication initiator protein
VPRKLDDYWSRFSRELVRLVGDERHALFARNLRPALLDEDLFLFHAENAYARGKLEALFQEAAVDAAQRATNRNVRVRFAVEPLSFSRSAVGVLRDAPRDGALPSREPAFSTFVAGAGNRLALAASRAFALGAPGSGRFLLLCAPSGLGKTHLLRAAERELRRRPGLPVLFFSGEQFRRHFAWAELRGHRDAFLKKCASAGAFLLDDLQLLAGRADAQLALADVLDALGARAARVALTLDRPPRAVQGLLPALRRRIRPDAEAVLEPSDPAHAAAVLAALAPPGVPRAVVDLVADAVRSGHKDRLHCLARLLASGPPTPSAARSVVAEFLNEWSRGLTYADIARAAAESFGVRLTAIYADERSRPATEARQACYYLSRKLLGEPFAAIGQHFGGRDHATVLEACRKLESSPGARLERLARALRRTEP